MHQRIERMSKYLVPMLFAFALLAQQAASADESVPVPEFTLEISLTKDASNKLAQAGESMSGTVYFDGDGPPLPGIKTAPFRDVFLGQQDFELEDAGLLTIKNASISKEAFLRLDDQNYHYFVNVYSGRRVFAENILTCSYADGRLDDLKARERIEIHCELSETPDNE
jgi:hypothetical protein